MGNQEVMMIINSSSDTERVYVPSNMEGRDIIDCKVCFINEETTSDYKVNRCLSLLELTIPCQNVMHSQTFKKQDEYQSLNNWKMKSLH